MTAIVAAAVALVSSSYYLGGLAGLEHLVLYLAATVPGWPIAWVAFGRRHAAGWVAAALLGYAMTCVTLAVAVRVGVHSASGFAMAWALVTVSTSLLLLWHRPEPIVALPKWTGRDTRALVGVLAVVLVLMVSVFRHVGAVDDDGARRYRAYFTADFVWHVALTNELARFQYPPTNPYAAPDHLHYYWSYFMVPTVSAAFLQRGVPHGAEPVLLVNALCAGVSFAAMLFISVWVVVPRPRVAAASVLLAVLAASAEGAWVLWGLWQSGGPLAGVKELNIDAMTMWRLQGLTIDGLPRSLWYVPQHAGACALGLIALVVAASARTSAGVASACIAGLALALAVAFSPFPGGVLAVVYGLGVVLVRLGRPRDMLRPVLVQVAAVALTALGVFWVVNSGMVEGAGGAVHLGLLGNARRAPVPTILYVLGPLLVPGVVGLFGSWRSPQLRPAAVGWLVGLAAFLLVSVEGDPVWVGWRAGQIMLISLPALAAAAFSRVHDTFGRTAVGVAFGLCFLTGLPTTLVDAYNAQDITNREMGPGFRWTVTITPDQQAAFEWMRTATPANAIVQADPVTRGRETWTLLQSFASRRATAGLPISLLSSERYDRLSSRVHDVFVSVAPIDAWKASNDLRLDYLYLDDVDQESLSAAAVEKFFRTPELFHVAFQRGAVTVFAVAHR